ncbi:site-specific integrase, partial [Bacteroides sp. OttesenSCG-928-D19]|nr:site-specific integrase [Bacteroides sp. OttesenSCG-928-D19]
GRIKSLHNKGQFVLRTEQKANTKNEYPIYIQYTLDRKVAKGTTNVWVKECDWDIGQQKVKRTHPQSVRLNKMLQKVQNDIEGQILDFSANKRLTIDVLRLMVKGRYNTAKEEFVDFVKYAEDNLETRFRSERIAYSTYSNGLNSLRLFRRFLLAHTSEDAINIKDVTEQLIDSYILWRKEDRGNSNESINKTLTPIMKAAKMAAGNGLMKPEIEYAISTKYLSIKKRLSDDDEEEVRYLTLEQLQQFYNLRNEVKYPRTKDYIDMFLFSFHACGLRFSDLLTLKWEHIDWENKKLTKILFKGNKRHTITLTNPAILILESWKKKNTNSCFVFDLLPSDFDLTNEQELYRQRINRNTSIKTSLKTLGKKMNLPFNLTIHCARHSFAVCALNEGVPVHKISKLLGHGSITVTETVYAQFLPEELEKEMESKLTFDFTSQS